MCVFPKDLQRLGPIDDIQNYNQQKSLNYAEKANIFLCKIVRVEEF